MSATRMRSSEFGGHHTQFLRVREGWCRVTSEGETRKGSAGESGEARGEAMPRLARVGVPGLPHHVTQRGNRRQRTFFEDGDYQAYIDLVAQWCGHWDVEVWAGLVRVGPLIERCGDRGTHLAQGLTAAHAALFRRHECTGRPMGNEGFVARIGKLLGRILHRRKPGPKGPGNTPKPRN